MARKATRKRGEPGQPKQRFLIPPWLFYLIAGLFAIAAFGLMAWSSAQPDVR